MGYMKTITILMDGWDQIEKHPDEFISQIAHQPHGTMSTEDRGVGNYVNMCVVHKAHHADLSELIIAGQNDSVNINDVKNVSADHFCYYANRVQEAQYLLDMAKKDMADRAGNLLVAICQAHHIRDREKILAIGKETEILTAFDSMKEKKRIVDYVYNQLN